MKSSSRLLVFAMAAQRCPKRKEKNTRSSQSLCSSRGKKKKKTNRHQFFLSTFPLLFSPTRYLHARSCLYIHDVKARHWFLISCISTVFWAYLGDVNFPPPPLPPRALVKFASNKFPLAATPSFLVLPLHFASRMYPPIRQPQH